MLVVPPEGTSHLSDYITNKSSQMASAQYLSQRQVPIQIPIKRLPPVSTPHITESPLSTAQFMPNNLQLSHNSVVSSVYTPINALASYP